MVTISYCSGNNSQFFSYTPSKNPFYQDCIVFFECICDKIVFLGSVCKNKGVHINIYSEFYIYSIFKTSTPSM
jgi:hypothetical protein